MRLATLALLLLLKTEGALGQDIPPEVIKYQSAIESIPGTLKVAIEKYDLAQVVTEDMSLLRYGDLPLGSLRRTDGGRANELLISARFDISRDEEGLRALEFLSWWVRDAARGSESIQIRSVALPPVAGQFGRTLSFRIDFFYSDPKQDMTAMLRTVGELGDSLKGARETYAAVFSR
jgi:hypothetical protein